MASTRLRAAMAGPPDELKVDMSPMIDMVFLLLIFFLVNATMIIVEMDPKVKPPIASKSDVAKDAKGRIVVNVYEDGTFMTEKGQLLETDEAIFNLIDKERQIAEQRSYEPKLHLRGHRDTVFRYCRRVIKIAARAKVDRVVFATYQVE